MNHSPHHSGYNLHQQAKLARDLQNPLYLPVQSGHTTGGLMGKKMRVGQKMMIQILSIDEESTLRRNHRMAVEGLLKKIERLEAKIALLSNKTTPDSTKLHDANGVLTVDTRDADAMDKPKDPCVPKIIIKKRFLNALTFTSLNKKEEK